MRFSLLPRSALALGAVALLAGLPVVSLASAARADSMTHLSIATASPLPRRVSLGLNKSMIVDLPANAREVIVFQRPTESLAANAGLGRARHCFARQPQCGGIEAERDGYNLVVGNVIVADLTAGAASQDMGIRKHCP